MYVRTYIVHMYIICSERYCPTGRCMYKYVQYIPFRTYIPDLDMDLDLASTSSHYLRLVDTGQGNSFVSMCEHCTSNRPLEDDMYIRIFQRIPP